MKWNTKTISLIAVLSALGIVLRYAVAIPVIPDVVELTPSFLIPEFAGMVMGLEGGIIVGTFVGLSGALRGGEFPLIPLLGNIALGISTGIVFFFMKEDNQIRNIITIISAGIIGGFIPTFTITLAFLPWTGNAVAAAAISASIDFLQAALWAAVGLPLRKITIEYLQLEGEAVQ